MNATNSRNSTNSSNPRWKRYYYRVIGFALAGAGAGLVLDELIHGPFTLTPTNHEFWGLVMLIAGAILISRKPHGKE
jgi:hypothetical protein